MYTQSDDDEIVRQLKVFWMVYIGISALFTAALVTLCVLRIAWPGFVLAPLMSFFLIAAWDLWGVKLVNYRRYLDDEKNTIPRETEAEVTAIREDRASYHNVPMVQVDIRILDDKGKEVDTFLYYDVEKLPVPFSQGDRIRVKTAGYCICEVLAVS